MSAILDRAGESKFCHRTAVMPQTLWRGAVGARIAERATPVSITGTTLVLRVPSSVWANELSLLSEQLCLRLRERGIEVNELRFRVGDTPAIERPAQRRMSRKVPSTCVLPENLLENINAVEDEYLRRSISLAAAANLAWQAYGTSDTEREVSGAQRGARAPQAYEKGTSPPAQTSPPADAATRRRLEISEGRRR